MRVRQLTAIMLNRGLGGMVMLVWVWVAVGASVIALFAFAWVTK